MHALTRQLQHVNGNAEQHLVESNCSSELDFTGRSKQCGADFVVGPADCFIGRKHTAGHALVDG